MMQTSLFDLFPKEPKPWEQRYKFGEIITWKKWEEHHGDLDYKKYADKWTKWYLSRRSNKWASINYTIWIKTYEMLSTYKSKTKKTNME